MSDQIRVFQNNEMIFKEGEYERCMYDIVSGSVNIYVNYGTADQNHLVTLKAGKYFGEIGISDLVPRTATAIAAEDDTRLAEITMENFYDYFRDDTAKVLEIMRNLSGRLRRLTKDYMEACRAVAEAGEAEKKGDKKSEGLIARLLKLAGRSGKPVYDDMAFDAQVQPPVEKADQCYTIHSYKKNDVIFREGDVSKVMYCINWGKVGIYADYGKPSQKMLAELKVDEFFGEMGMIDGMPRSATAVALEDNTEMVVVSEAGFPEYLKEKPTVVMMMMQHLSARVRRLTKDYIAVCKLVAETMSEEQNGAGGKKGWLKENVVAFAREYSEAVKYVNEHPDIYVNSYNFRIH